MKTYDTAKYFTHEGNLPKEVDYIRARLLAWQELINDHNLQEVIEFNFDELYFELKLGEFFSEWGYPMIYKPDTNPPISIRTFLEIIAHMIVDSQNSDTKISSLVSELHNEGIKFNINGFDRDKFK